MLWSPGGEDQGSSGHIGPLLKSHLAFCTPLPLPTVLWHTEHSAWVRPCQPNQGTGLLCVPVTLGIPTDPWLSTAVPWHLRQLTWSLTPQGLESSAQCRALSTL